MKNYCEIVALFSTYLENNYIYECHVTACMLFILYIYIMYNYNVCVVYAL